MKGGFVCTKSGISRIPATTVFTTVQVKGHYFPLFVWPPKLMSSPLSLNKPHLFLPALQGHCSFMKISHYDEPSIEWEELYHVIQPLQPQRVGVSGERITSLLLFPQIVSEKVRPPIQGLSYTRTCRTSCLLVSTLMSKLRGV